MNLEEMLKKRPGLPPKILIYTIPGWGKSTLAASMPSPVVIDVDDGLDDIEVKAFLAAKKYDEVEDQMRMLISEQHEYKTVVIDTLSSLEKLIFKKICDDAGNTSIEDFGYGKGYTLALTYWNKIIDGCDKLRAKGIATVLLAHSEVKPITDPIVGSYDKYIIRMHKHPAAMIEQWAGCILFGTYRTVIAKQGDGLKKTSKGIGHGERVIFTEERPAFTAKNRMGLPFEIDIPKCNGWAAIKKNFNKEK